MLTIEHRTQRPGEGWHAHGTTSKILFLILHGQLQPVRLIKQRWLHIDSGTTRHDRPVWDPPGGRYGFDVVTAALAVWLVASVGLHRVDWTWKDEKPARRSVQRWAAHLAPHAAEWLQAARERIIDYVAPRHLEELLPAGGIPPPKGARLRPSQGNVLIASQLRDVIWLHENTARALSIPLRTLLVVARWRWPEKRPISRPA